VDETAIADTPGALVLAGLSVATIEEEEVVTERFTVPVKLPLGTLTMIVDPA